MRPIKMTQEVAEAAVREAVMNFTQQMITAGLSFGVKTKKYAFNPFGSMKLSAEEKVVVNFTAKAYAKMMALIKHYSSEVGWNGFVRKMGDNAFEIYDIVVYPQKVTAATISTDQEEFEKWLDTLPDEEYNARRMHGHSHVDMHVDPSGTDIEDQERLISGMSTKDVNPFFIFMIWNKRFEFFVRVFDVEKNLMYEPGDIVVTVEGLNTDGFIEETKTAIRKHKYSVSGVTTKRRQVNQYLDFLNGASVPGDEDDDDDEDPPNNYLYSGYNVHGGSANIAGGVIDYGPYDCGQ